MSSLDDYLPCRSLTLAGIPGCGKSTQQARLCGILETDGTAWRGMSALDFHTEDAIKKIRAGKLLKSTSYWRDFFDELARFYARMDKAKVPIIMRGTFLTRGLRKKIVDLGRDPDTGKSDHYLIWLSVSADKASERLAQRHNDEPDAIFQPEWLQDYLSITEEPVVVEEKSSRKLRLTEEENVFSLDADRDDLWRKTDFICNEVPALRDHRMRANPED